MNYGQKYGFVKQLVTVIHLSANQVTGCYNIVQLLHLHCTLPSYSLHLVSFRLSRLSEQNLHFNYTNGFRLSAFVQVYNTSIKRP
jgi:hypothetical protein